MNQSVEAPLPLADELLRHAGWSRRLAGGLLGDESQAEDAAQDAWVSALRFRPRADRPLAAWLRAVLRNRLINRRRSDGRRRATEQRYEAAASVHLAPPPSPEELLERLQTQRLLAELVSALAEPYRQTVLLRYFEGRSSEEIAAQMRLPAATVRGRLRTALAELREALELRCGGRRAWVLALKRLRTGPEGEVQPELGRQERQVAPGLPAGAALLRWISAAALLAGAALVVLWAARWRADGVVDAPGETAAAVAGGSRPAEMPTWAGFRAAGGEPTPLERLAPADPRRVDPPARPVAAGEAEQTGTIAGTVRVQSGAVPAPEVVDVSADPFCARFPPADAGDLLVRDSRLANVVVRVTRGWIGRAPVPAEPVRLEQRGCRYLPRVLVARAGQMIAVQNEDEILHAVWAAIGEPGRIGWVRTGGSTPVAESLAFRARAVELRAQRGGDIIRLACDTHPWMTAHVVVSETPFFAVTDEEGHYRLDGVPPGTYWIEAWHERLGARQREVTVQAGSLREVSFDFGAERPQPGLAGTGLCGIAVGGTSPVALACQKNGLRGAKVAMKSMVALGKKRGIRFECADCHRNDTDWTLLEDARRKFESLPPPAR